MRNKLSTKLITLHEKIQLDMNVPTAIFGTIGTLQQNIQARETYRIGIWPTIHPDDPATGIGLMSLLAYMLDSLHDVRAYTLFVREDKTQDSFIWSDTQFGIEDWQPDDLNENVGIAGTLTRRDDGWSWALEVENDLVDESHADSTFTLTYDAPNLADLVNQIAAIASALMARVGMEDARFDVYSTTSADDARIIGLMRPLANWQVHLVRSLMNYDWPEDKFAADMGELAEAGARLGDSFGGWASAVAIAHALLPGYNHKSINKASNTFINAIRKLNDQPFAAIYIGHAIYQHSGDADAGYRLLEQAVNDHPSAVFGWLTLADAYRRGGRIIEMIDTFQRAIEIEAVNVTLYRNYGAVLELLNEEGLLQQVILIDPADYDDSLAMWEAIAAYDEALKLQPGSTVLLHRRTQLLLDVAEDDIDAFTDSLAELIDHDSRGDYVRSIIDQLGALDDLDAVFDVLEEAIERHPDRIDLHVSLAAAYINAEDYELASEELETAQTMTDSVTMIADIERLLLTTADPDFEGRFAEIEAQVDGGVAIGSRDVSFLEDAIERAPSLADAWVLLGKAYYERDETTDAIETLLEGYQHHPQDVELLMQIGRILWETGEGDTALQYLNEALAINPSYVPLLAQVGLYLFEDNQDETARIYLARAEAISPRDPALNRARKAIAELLSGRR